MVEGADVSCREDGVPVASFVFDLKTVQAHLMIEGVAVGHLGDIGSFKRLSLATGFTSK